MGSTRDGGGDAKAYCLQAPTPSVLSGSPGLAVGKNGDKTGGGSTTKFGPGAVRAGLVWRLPAKLKSGGEGVRLTFVLVRTSPFASVSLCQ